MRQEGLPDNRPRCVTMAAPCPIELGRTLYSAAPARPEKDGAFMLASEPVPELLRRLLPEVGGGADCIPSRMPIGMARGFIASGMCGQLGLVGPLRLRLATTGTIGKALFLSRMRQWNRAEELNYLLQSFVLIGLATGAFRDWGPVA